MSPSTLLTIFACFTIVHTWRSLRMYKSLTESNKHLQEELSERTFELLRINEKLERDVIYRKRLTDCLEEEREALIESQEKTKRIAELKSHFLTTMSHEIRVPLTAIVGLSDLIEPHHMEALEQEALNNIKRSAKGLIELVNNIIDLSLIETGHLEIRKEMTTLNDAFTNCVETLKIQADKKGIGLRTIIDKALPELVFADIGRLNQIVQNIAQNAIKFTYKGQVIIHVSYQGNRQGALRFRVIDTGLGIAINKQRMIFDAFVKAHDEIFRDYNGRGLGLSIAKSLTELMSGSIHLESPVSNEIIGEYQLKLDKEQKGSMFEILIPIELFDEKVQEDYSGMRLDELN